MPSDSQITEQKNPMRPAAKKLGLCGVCGEEVIAATLQLQRGTPTCVYHRGCWDNPRVYRGQRTKGVVFRG